MRRSSLTLGLGGLALLLAGASLRPAAASESPRTELLQRQVSLAPLRLDDVATRPVEALGHSERTARRVGAYLVADGALATPPVRLTVTREVPALWRQRRDPARVAPDGPLRLQLSSAAGFDALQNNEDPAARLPVRVGPAPLRVIARDERGETVEGGVVLEFDLATVKAGGHYSGDLHLDFEEP